MPAFEESFLAILAHPLPTICFNFQFPVLADVGKVSRHSTDFLAASRDLDYDFRGAPPDRSANLLDLRGGEATGLRRPRSAAAKQIQVGTVSEGDVKGVPAHQSGSPRP